METVALEKFAGSSIGKFIKGFHERKMANDLEKEKLRLQSKEKMDSIYTKAKVGAGIVGGGLATAGGIRAYNNYKEGKPLTD